MDTEKTCPTCNISKPLGQFKRLKGYGGSRDRQCRDCYRDKVDARIRYETDVKLKEYGYKISRMTGRSNIEKATKALLAHFGGAEKFAKEYFELYERVKYQRTDTDSSPAAYMVIAVLNLCNAAGHIQEESLETDAYHEEAFNA